MTRHLLHVIFGSLAGTLTVVFLTYSDSHFSESYSLYVYSGILGIFLSYILEYSSTQLSKWLHWKRSPGMALFGSLLLNFLIVCFSLIGFAKLFELGDSGSSAGLIADIYIKVAILSFLMMIVYSILYLAYRSFRYYQTASLDSIQLETRQIDLQLMALKAQLSPHFLFNSLNTISSLIYDKQDLAEQYIRNLAKIYQYTLPSYERKVVRFEEEWGYVKANNDLLKTRFGECLFIVLENEEALAPVNLPPLTLQLLVENVLKHNQIDGQNTVTITIRRDGRWWEITNNKTSTPKSVSSFKIGLENIVDRYALLTDSKVRIIDEQNFTVKLPVL